MNWIFDWIKRAVARGPLRDWFRQRRGRISLSGESGVNVDGEHMIVLSVENGQSAVAVGSLLATVEVFFWKDDPRTGKSSRVRVAVLSVFLEGDDLTPPATSLEPGKVIQVRRNTRMKAPNGVVYRNRMYSSQFWY